MCLTLCLAGIRLPSDEGLWVSRVWAAIRKMGFWKPLWAGFSKCGRRCGVRIRGTRFCWACFGYTNAGGLFSYVKNKKKMQKKKKNPLCESRLKLPSPSPSSPVAELESTLVSQLLLGQRPACPEHAPTRSLPCSRTKWLPTALGFMERRLRESANSLTRT